MNELRKGFILRDYEILELIGRGGFGLVYKGMHRQLGVQVAIKEYFPSDVCHRVGHSVQPSRLEFQASFEESLNRFVSEAKQLEKFRDCPNVVTCRDLFHANGTAYIVMDYIHGLPLSVLLKRREALGEPFTELDLVRVISPLLRGLHIVHQSGVYHRDVKPSNILIRRDDNSPVLIDFGAAKHQISKHTQSVAPYSDGYAAVEQLGEGEIGPWTDLYGIGAVMWRMVAGGAPPYSPPNPLPSQQRAYQITQGQPDPLPSARNIGHGRFSSGLLQAIDQCMSIKVSKRIQDCGQLLDKLNASLGRSNPTDVPSIADNKQPNHQPSYPSEDDSLRPNPIKKRRLILILLIGSALLTGAGSIAYQQTALWQHFTAYMGRAEAQFHLGAMYDHGDRVAEDDEEAFKWYSRAADQGLAIAQLSLGHLYYHGDGIEENHEEAFRWYSLAADQNHAEAQLRLGHMYHRGEGISQNDAEAFLWYQLAAQQGLAEAQLQLGEFYFSGTGITMNQSIASEWFHLAAEQGLAEAQLRLGLMYLSGQGVSKNPVEAFKWLSLAAEQGFRTAQDLINLMDTTSE
ncbi:MAG: serine/threonine-protein kinase [Bacteroidetes bacterium]|nr:serine/threonine-protein kinase [Bacteroidota bacterium]